MSVLLKTLKAFPRGRKLEELHALLGTTFQHSERVALLAELETLAQNGLVRRQSTGLWVPVITAQPLRSRVKDSFAAASPEAESLVAAPFTRRVQPTEVLEDATAQSEGDIDPNALLRYWRSALRADPRGATEETFDRHGAVWHLISGHGGLVPEQDQSVQLKIPLDAVAADFRAALLKREATEKTLAIGWPLALGRRSGVPVVWPIGLIAAEWRRVDGYLEVEITADDVLVNPDWLKGAARSTGWRAQDLESVFAQSDAVGLPSDEFLSRLRDAAASQIKGRLTGQNLIPTLDISMQGVFDAAALFLPQDSSFTAGAGSDLEAIAGWPTAKLARTALGPLLGLAPMASATPSPALNVGAINAEQIAAVRAACSAVTTVVTGPPGTGKSQAIVSMAASVLLAGGSVLVASKNHQALDAVEERLGGLAPEASFLIRTLNAEGTADRSFISVLTELAQGDAKRHRPVSENLRDDLQRLADRRIEALDNIARHAELQCAIAELLERLEARTTSDAPPSTEDPAQAERVAVLLRLLAWIERLFRKTAANEVQPAAGRSLEERLAELRETCKTIEISADVIELTDQIAALAGNGLRATLDARSTPTPEQRSAFDHAKADLDFAAGRPVFPADIARDILEHRPLWLVSVLGAARRLPLIEGLFDLVIFDEASQCDIASALPLFARARRAVVVGDNQQLTFIAQLGRAQDRNLMQAQGLPLARMSRYAQSRQSLFDFAMRVNGAERVQLRQQYRSVGPIVDYISQEFYGSTLKTAYDPEKIIAPENQKVGLAWTHVPAPIALKPNNVNPAEVSAIVDHITQLLITNAYAGTIGVTSPFRGQVGAIDQAVRAAIPDHKLVAADFRVATVDGFQGQERDLILFSPSLTAASPMSAVSFVQKDYRRINVAISRARAVAHIFGDLDFARSNKVRSLCKLAAAATEPRSRVGTGQFDSKWEEIVYHALKSRGLDPIAQYEIAGRRLDFALFGAGGIKLDLEVDGRAFHETTDGQRKISDHWRDHQLKSLGWTVRRFWVDELASNMERCLDLVERDLS